MPSLTSRRPISPTALDTVPIFSKNWAASGEMSTMASAGGGEPDPPAGERGASDEGMCIASLGHVDADAGGGVGSCHVEIIYVSLPQ